MSIMKTFLSKTAVLYIFSFLLFIFLGIIVERVRAADASFALSPASGNYNLSETFDINVLMDTGIEETVGADMKIKFSNNVLSLVALNDGTVFDQYPGKTIDNEKGSAFVSGIKTNGTKFSGSGNFATLRFKAIAPGTATVDFVFTQGDPDDTNIVSLKLEKDILSSVTNGTYIVAGGKGGVGPAEPTQEVPVTAGYFSTSLLALLSTVLIAIGFIIFKTVPA